MSDDLKHMKREELVEVVARAMREAWRDREDMRSETQEWENICGAEFIDCIASADAALTALCAALRIPPAALDALAAGEAVVVPARGGITAQMEIAGGNVLDFKAVEAMAREEWHPDDAARRIYRAMVSASPYAAPDAEGGA